LNTATDAYREAHLQELEDLKSFVVDCRSLVAALVEIKRSTKVNVGPAKEFLDWIDTAHSRDEATHLIQLRADRNCGLTYRKLATTNACAILASEIKTLSGEIRATDQSIESQSRQYLRSRAELERRIEEAAKKQSDLQRPRFGAVRFIRWECIKDPKPGIWEFLNPVAIVLFGIGFCCDILAWFVRIPLVPAARRAVNDLKIDLDRMASTHVNTLVAEERTKNQIRDRIDSIESAIRTLEGAANDLSVSDHRRGRRRKKPRFPAP